MRYSKAALLTFGLGLVLGFGLVVIGGFPRLERLASALMAIGLAALPVGVMADRWVAVRAWFAARLSKSKPRRWRGQSRPPMGRRKSPGRKTARAPRRKRS